MGARLFLPGDTKSREWVGTLTEEEMGESSTYRELLTVLQLLEKFKSELEGHVFRTYMDSSAAVRILLKFGSNGSESCNDLCTRIAALCRDHNVTIQPVWVPREENTAADKLSKYFDRGTIRREVTQEVRRHFGGNTT